MDIKQNKIASFFSELFNSIKETESIQNSNTEIESDIAYNKKADWYGGGASNYAFNSFSLSFNGEKNLGEVGPIIKYTLDYNGLRLRSWQSLIESEVTQTIINKYATWVIGEGLKLTSEPAKDVLLSEGIKMDSQVYSKSVEQRFNLWKTSKTADYSKMVNLDMIANTAFINSIVGGDVLVVLRYEGVGRQPSVQLIDGAHIQSPNFGTEQFPTLLPNGNRCINGVELNECGETIAYYVRNKDFKFDRIIAKGEKSNLTIAYLVKGGEYRLDNNRGVPLIAAVLEKLKKLERYESATLGSAEERQKIVMSIEHDNNSTGESPMTKQLSRASNWNDRTEDLPKDLLGTDLANSIATSTNKQVFNMPIGSKLQSLESKNELYFKDYYTVNIIAVCAALGIPYQVAMSLYEGNFSASRAALKDWENTLNVVRKKFSFQFYQPIFNFWLEVQILENKINAPGYLTARLKNDDMVIESFRKCRFVGAPVPHIDPLKEVKAVREMLGDTGKSIPLITVEAATEKLNNGESNENMLQYAGELKDSIKEGIQLPQIQPQQIPTK